MAYTTSKFAIRKVVNGQVRIAGQTYSVSQEGRPYNGELDGQKFAFGRYKCGDMFEGFVYLWGTEKEFRSGTPLENPPNVIDGFIYWDWWHLEQSKC